MIYPELMERSESICGFPPPTEINRNGWKMVDAELSVVSSTLDGLPEWVKDQFLEDTSHDDVHSLTFFYHPGADAVVLNSEHKNADIYELLVTAYLLADEQERQEFKKLAPKDCIDGAIELLDYLIEERRKLQNEAK